MSNGYNNTLSCVAAVCLPDRSRQLVDIQDWSLYPLKPSLLWSDNAQLVRGVEALLPQGRQAGQLVMRGLMCTLPGVGMAVSAPHTRRAYSPYHGQHAWLMCSCRACICCRAAEAASQGIGTGAEGYAGVMSSRSTEGDAGNACSSSGSSSRRTGALPT